MNAYERLKTNELILKPNGDNSYCLERRPWTLSVYAMLSSASVSKLYNEKCMSFLHHISTKSVFGTI